MAVTYTDITESSQQQVRPNFQAWEFHSQSYDAPETHPMSNVSMDAAQALRDFWGVPVSITSTHRTIAGNIAVGGSPTSQHLGYGAIDLQPSSQSIRAEKINQLYNDLACKGPLYQELKAIGVKGIGIYDSFVHIDDGAYAGNPRVSMAFWDMSSGQYGPVNLSTAFMATVPESGNPECGQTGFNPSQQSIEKHSSKKKL